MVVEISTHASYGTRRSLRAGEIYRFPFQVSILENGE